MLTDTPCHPSPDGRGGSSSSSPTRTPRFFRKRSTRGSQEGEQLPGPPTPGQADHRTPGGGQDSPLGPPQGTRKPLLSQQQEARSPAASPKRPSLPIAIEAKLVRVYQGLGSRSG